VLRVRPAQPQVPCCNDSACASGSAYRFSAGGPGGGGAGGSILIQKINATLGTITAPGGLGNTLNNSYTIGGDGAVGRIAVQ
jgi:hypothetical protein